MFSLSVHFVTLSISSQVGVIFTLLMLLMLYSSAAFLFVGTLALGLCISSVYPCMLAYTEDMLNYKGIASKSIPHI